MLVFWKERLVIFSVPKTGTSALDDALSPHADIVMRNPPTLKHIPVYRYNRFIQPLFDVVNAPEMETVALIREPFDWLGSWYRYRQRDDMHGHPNATHDVTFDEFVREAMKGKPAAFANVGSQAKFLGGGIGPSGVTHLFQYEQYELATAFLSDRLGWDVSPKAKNISPKADLNLSDGIREKYSRKRHEEFDMWAAARR